MFRNDENRPAVILFITIILLIAASFIPAVESVMGIPIKNVDILMDIKAEFPATEQQLINEEELWDENDDFFKDDEPAKVDSSGQSADSTGK